MNSGNASMVVSHIGQVTIYCRSYIDNASPISVVMIFCAGSVWYISNPRNTCQVMQNIPLPPGSMIYRLYWSYTPGIYICSEAVHQGSVCSERLYTRDLSALRGIGHAQYRIWSFFLQFVQGRPRRATTYADIVLVLDLVYRHFLCWS